MSRFSCFHNPDPDSILLLADIYAIAAVSRAYRRLRIKQEEEEGEIRLETIYCQRYS